MELIVPVVYSSPWSSIIDLKGFQFFMSIEKVYTARDSLNALLAGNTGIFLGRIKEKLYSRIFYEAGSNEPNLSLRYKEVAAEIYNSCCTDSFVLRDKSSILNNNTALNKTYESSLMKLVSYKNPPEFLETLTNCEKKTAYIDSTNNIMNLLPYLNNHKGSSKVFLKGDDGFLSSYYGWVITPLRRGYSFAEKRLKWLITSGLYQYWRDWYQRNKPEQLFHHYGNWSQIKPDPVLRLDFNSKISAAFYVWCIGIGLICLPYFCIELALVKHNWCRNKKDDNVIFIQVKTNVGDK
jgi:hypothetical protein